MLAVIFQAVALPNDAIKELTEGNLTSRPRIHIVKEMSADELESSLKLTMMATEDFDRGLIQRTTKNESRITAVVRSSTFVVRC